MKWLQNLLNPKARSRAIVYNVARESWSARLGLNPEVDRGYYVSPHFEINYYSCKDTVRETGRYFSKTYIKAAAALRGEK